MGKVNSSRPMTRLNSVYLKKDFVTGTSMAGDAPASLERALAVEAERYKGKTNRKICMLTLHSTHAKYGPTRLSLPYACSTLACQQ